MSPVSNNFQAEWGTFVNQLGRLAIRLWERSSGETLQSTSPEAFSTQLFKRFKDHRNSFALLWNEHLAADSETALRSAIEAAICLANLRVRPEEFIDDLRSDAAWTLERQSALWGFLDPDLGTASLVTMKATFGLTRSDGRKHKPFDWKTLARGAGLPQLYDWHRNLSATASHVTGLSIILDSYSPEVAGSQQAALRYRQMRREASVRWMCAATQISCQRHSATMKYRDLEVRAQEFTEPMNALSRREIEAEG